MKIKNKLFKNKRTINKRTINQKKFYELTYIVEDHQQKRLSELAERFRKINGWNEKEMLQFAITATSQTDLEMKFKFLEDIISDLEKVQQI